MTPIVAYLLVLDGLVAASYVGWWFVRRAADQEHQTAASMVIAASFGMLGPDGAYGEDWDGWSERYLGHDHRARDLERVAGWMRAGIAVLSGLVLVTAAVVLLP